MQGQAPQRELPTIQLFSIDANFMSTKEIDQPLQLR